MEEQKIDRDVIALMDDATLANYIPSYGDRIAVFNFCRSKKSLPKRMQGLLAKLRKKMRVRKESAKKTLHEDTRTTDTETLKTTRNVEIGWLHDDGKGAKQVPSSEIAMVQEQLRDALGKNQHWLVYDQQREAYVLGILARTVELEQQLNQAKQTHQQQHKEANSEGQSSASMQQEKQLQESQREMEEERKRACHLQAELDELKARYEEKSRELMRAQEELQEERRSGRQILGEEMKLNMERVARLQCEIEAADVRIEEERKRAVELLLQVNLLQKSLLTQHEDQQRTAVLEQQIHLVAGNCENEGRDRQRLQRQLHKVLKELRKVRDQITRLETAKQHRETRFSEPSSYRLYLEKITIQDRILNPTSPVKRSSMLNESFLDCPNCRASYSTSQHRELLAHLDYCFG